MRTDRQLQQDVEAELAWEPSIDAAHIGVAAHDGVITLTGHAGSYAQSGGARFKVRAPVPRAMVAHD